MSGTDRLIAVLCCAVALALFTATTIATKQHENAAAAQRSK
jgi:hypothetical protein